MAVNVNIVIMAGGGGTRLWPLSRQKQPKQFVDLGTGRTLVEDAYQRAKRVTAADNIYVATSSKYRKQIKKYLPDVPDERVFFEPEKRDTTAAFVSVAIRLQTLGQADTPTTFMWADHVFTNEAEFINDLRKIPAIVEQYPDHLVIVGHNPVTPEVNLGYMKVGKKIPDYSDVFYLEKFTEKPDLATAKKFLAAGNYYWNLGYFSMKPSYLIQELKDKSPEVAEPIDNLIEAVASNDEDKISDVYSKFPKISIEYTLIEKTKRILAITGDYGWADIGYWSTVQEIFGTDGDHAPKGHHLHVSSQGCYIYNATDKAVTLIGLKDVIVVVTDDAVLVTSKDESHQVKEVVAQFEKDQQSNLL